MAAGLPSFNRTYPTQSQLQLEFKPGEHYFIKREGADWPVVICDEEIVRKHFKSRFRPENARQADGTWGTDYQLGGSRAGQKCYPTLILGILKFCWTSWKALEVFDLGMGKAIRETAKDPLLSSAWREANDSYEMGNRDIEYWKRKLGSRGRANQVEQLPESRKRKGSPKCRYPPGYTREKDVDDDEGADLYLSSKDHPKVKHEVRGSTSPSEIDALYRDPDPPYLRLGSVSSKKSKFDSLGRLMTANNQTRTKLESPAHTSSVRSQSYKQTSDIDPDKVTIYIGNPHQMFKAKRSSLDASALLSNLAVFQPEMGWYIMSPMLSALEVSDFFPVGQYLERGEYQPNLLDEDTEWVRFEEDMTDRERAREAVRCAKTYSIARSLELPALQDLAFRKLKALAKNEPHQADTILHVIELVFNDANEDLRDYLISYLAENYWEIVLAETKKTMVVMTSSQELSKGVFARLSESSGPDSIYAKMEEDHKIKHEEGEKPHENARATPEVSETTFQGNSKRESPVDKGLSETEDEMLRTALNLSREEYAAEIKEQSEQCKQSVFFQPRDSGAKNK